MMEPAPAASFVMAEAKFLLQLLIVSLDDPAMFGHMHQIGQRNIRRQRGKPVFGWFRFAGRPFDQQPFFRMWFRPPIIPMCRADS